jgi:biopolymer transport protein ExbD
MTKQEMEMWRVRPAGAEHQGRAVPWPRLAQAINGEEVGDLDEVQGPGESKWLPIGEHSRASEYLPAARRSIIPDPEEAESDLTPMIDVTFQLLIFFMIAATYTIQKTLDLPSMKPDPEGAATMTMEELEQNNIMVKIAGDGAVTVQDKLVPLDDVYRSLNQAVSQMRTAELVLDVDDQAVHDVVVKVIDAAGAAQIQKILFVSRVPAAGAPP